MVIESEPRDSDVNGSKGDGQVIGYAVWLLWPRGKGEKGVVLPGVKRKGFGDGQYIITAAVVCETKYANLGISIQQSNVKNSP